MDVKQVIKYILVVGLICFALYLTYSVISGNISQKNQEENYCTAKCNYSQYSHFWEFSGEYSTKGFTTKEECFNFCSRSFEGFVFRILDSGYASLMSIPFLSDFLKPK